MKILTKINNKQNINLYEKNSDGFILGLKDFSVGFDFSFSIDEIKNIIELFPNKEIFVSMNKNIFNDELVFLEEKLIELNSIGIKGILFYDMSVLYLKNKNNLNVDLVWNQTHMVTNYNTCNYYYDKGCKYAYVSGEITLEEIIEIKEKSKSTLMVEVVSHQVMSHSKRKLLTNYYNSIDKTYDGEVKTISEKNESYLIKEDNTGTVIKTGKILNGIPIIRDLVDSNIEYLVVDESEIDCDVVSRSLELINEVISNNNIDENINLSYSLLGDNTSFFFKKTIYKVKKGDK